MTPMAAPPSPAPATPTALVRPAVARAAAELSRHDAGERDEALIENVATVKDTLDRIEGRLSHLRLPPDLQAAHGPITSGRSTPEGRRGKVLALIRARSSRTSFFDSELFGDPCWDMLLDLMLARLDGKQVSVSSLCIAANVPSTTALRRLDELIAASLVERVPDADDRRRIHVRLTDAAVQRIERYLDQIGVVLNG